MSPDRISINSLIRSWAVGGSQNLLQEVASGAFLFMNTRVV